MSCSCFELEIFRKCNSVCLSPTGFSLQVLAAKAPDLLDFHKSLVNLEASSKVHIAVMQIGMITLIKYHIQT